MSKSKAVIRRRGRPRVGEWRLSWIVPTRVMKALRAASVIDLQSWWGWWEAGLVAERQEATFCQPWRGQPAARWNRRATRPNAMSVSVINDRVDPPSGVALPGLHTPGR